MACGGAADPGGALTGGALTGWTWPQGVSAGCPGAGGALTDQAEAGGALVGGALTGGALTGGALTGWVWLQGVSAGCPGAGGALTDQAEAGGALTGCPSAPCPVTADDGAADALTGDAARSVGAEDSGVRPVRAASSSSSGPIC
ncbi:hypothetical protein [Micromonospora sp. NPDC049891]|uniref:hypothetical protein n=1 Tax=Micromonospora sp. NPDC049891 TaxID=3155655 RepID=UPI00340B8872